MAKEPRSRRSSSRTSGRMRWKLLLGLWVQVRQLRGAGDIGQVELEDIQAAQVVRRPDVAAVPVGRPVVARRTATGVEVGDLSRLGRIGEVDGARPARVEGGDQHA